MKNDSGHNGLIGLFNDSFPPIIDGVTLTVENYLYWLSRKGENPLMVTPWNPNIVETDYKVLRYFSLPIQGRKPYRYGYPKLDPFIWKKLRNTDFRLVHSHSPFSSGRLAVYTKRKLNIPLVGTFHSKYRTDLEHGFSHTPWMVPIIMGRILDFFNSCDEVWIPQAYVEETVREYGYRGKLRVMENGNDFSDIISGDVADFKKKARHRLGYEDDKLLLLFVGQHINAKGVDFILRVLNSLREKVNFHMNFIGTGNAVDDMRDYIAKHGLGDRVTLHGVIKERDPLSEFYAASDLFLFPSFYDNAPLVVREAAALATPSVVLKGSTASEVITDKSNGYIADEREEDFCRLILWLNKNRNNILQTGIGARNSIVRSWKDVVDEVYERYAEIITNYNRK